jgi:hypothetical protein
MSDKYKNGKIYTIRYKNDDSLIYVGSTVQPLFKRWHQHKSNVNNEKRNDLILYQNKYKSLNIIIDTIYCFDFNKVVREDG